LRQASCQIGGSIRRRGLDGGEALAVVGETFMGYLGHLNS